MFLFFFFKKHKPHAELFLLHRVVQYHHFQNYTVMTCYTYYGIQI